LEKINLDSSLNHIHLKVLKLELKILKVKYNAENHLILFDFDFNYSGHIRKLALSVHNVLIQVLSFLSKSTSKKLVLDCQCEKTESTQIIIKCGICASRIIVLSKRYQTAKEKSTSLHIKA
jgi:hypothetical protein